MIAVLLWGASTIAEITVGTPIPRATLALAGAVLLSLVSTLPPLTGTWARRANVALGVAAAVVAGFYAYDPQSAADIMRLVPVVEEIADFAPEAQPIVPDGPAIDGDPVTPVDVFDAEPLDAAPPSDAPDSPNDASSE